jgi:hypothetical protein
VSSLQRAQSQVSPQPSRAHTSSIQNQSPVASTFHFKVQVVCFLATKTWGSSSSLDVPELGTFTQSCITSPPPKKALCGHFTLSAPIRQDTKTLQLQTPAVLGSASKRLAPGSLPLITPARHRRSHLPDQDFELWAQEKVLFSQFFFFFLFH